MTDYAALKARVDALYLDYIFPVLATLRVGEDASAAALEEAFDWWAETGDMLIELPDNKYLSRLQIRASVTQDSTLKIEAMYDSDGDWRVVYRRGKSRKASFTVPLIPARCDHLRLRISGHGRSAVYAISKEIERGSEL